MEIIGDFLPLGVPVEILTCLIALFTVPDRPMLLLLFKLARWLNRPDNCAAYVCEFEEDPWTLTSFKLRDLIPL